MKLKIRRTGNSLSTIWPRDVLARLNVKEGDELYAVETTHGVLVTPYDPAFEKAMETAREVMARDRDALKALAKQ
ncbi:MAG: AbrB/MazE/SpoVT family DNA-binding domain-containing protein [Alphaproteobacteria bacterium]